MPWMRAIAVAGAATALAVGGVAACGTSAVTSPSGSRAALGASNAAPTTPGSPAPTAASSPAIASAAAPTPAPHAVVKAKHAARIVPSLSALDPMSSVVATASHGVAIYAAPNGSLLRHFSARTELGAPRTFLVTGTRGTDWLQVELPIRPNGSRGWIRSSAVMTAVTTMAIDVDRRAHVLTLLRNGAPVRTFPVAVGAPATPTPTGAFFISDRLPTLAPYGPYGPYALGLSGYSDVLLTFAGADGVLGIHGTNEDWSVGHPVSHGCIRMHNSDVTWLYRKIGLGAAVIVH
jgi:lipoprotein-anchoring transpeptidase ErfK/SrfK